MKWFTKKMAYWMLIGMCLGAIVFFAAACTEQQLDRADKAADVAAVSVDAAHEVINSPAGLMIPEPVRSMILLVASGFSSLIAFWKTNQSRIRGVVLRSVVQAIDSPGDTKQAVKTNLQAAGIESQGRAIIATMKTATPAAKA